MFSAVLLVIASAALIAFMVLDMSELNPLTINSPRIYWIQYKNEDTIIFDAKFRRGEKLEKPATNPVHSEDEYYSYTFKGWDITGDNNPDILPTRAFYSFLAIAVYSKKQIKPIPTSSDEPSSESEANLISLGGDYGF